MRMEKAANQISEEAKILAVELGLTTFKCKATNRTHLSSCLGCRNTADCATAYEYAMDKILLFAGRCTTIFADNLASPQEKIGDY